VKRSFQRCPILHVGATGIEEEEEEEEEELLQYLTVIFAIISSFVKKNAHFLYVTKEI
jgi:hypothetical protein